MGERMNKYFLGKHKSITGSSIAHLKVFPEGRADGEGGRTVNSPQEMLKGMTEFYSALWDEKPSDKVERDFFLRKIKRVITDQDVRGLLAPYTAAEVYREIVSGGSGTSPGTDGFPYEVYKAITRREKVDDEYQYSEICHILASVFNDVARRENLPNEFLDGVLSILHKKGDPALLSNYRPLTVMNTDYRLYTAILAKRMTSAFKNIIGEYQMAFMPGRLIDDNIRLVQGLIDRYKETPGEGLVMLFLDQVKAYDRVGHEWMYKILRKFRVPKIIIQRIQALSTGTGVWGYINGYRTENLIQTKSGVRQGDALSCILFNITIEVLHLAILEDPRISGIPLKEGSTAVTKSAGYADDTVIFLKDDRSAIAAATLMERYEKASGSRTNWKKSYKLSIGDMAPSISIYPQIRVVSPDDPQTLGYSGFEDGEDTAKLGEMSLVDARAKACSGYIDALDTALLLQIPRTQF
ncbi:hypothetical protein PTNB85_10532 [Pyrenophora teres f. teres]|nr:hypothetical protein HRS9139_10542 [Pyrenophora teres f. teres]KAE8821944.1 hypothetical protein PTNB85_10605 [Pyrenophora teres f. teres]KAE8821946.1 hypothetical protein PTNB85_10607 [Pyrenophora teres f. teres]KAE8821957.1 hypothetical protein PTNB85_10598 [Pyrenophora teres f. teres]KAE8822005.1 hypothetical protein HRS9139_10508 [Pyrenophora teres f. teres]